MGNGKKGKMRDKPSTTQQMDHFKVDSHSQVQISQFHEVMEEVEAGLAITWKEIVVMCVGVLTLGIASVAIGIAAGMTISIHYYEEPRRLGDDGPAPIVFQAQRVTTLDSNIASHNVLQHEQHRLDLGRVVTTTASGQRNVLSVVQETPPLAKEAGLPPSDDSARNIEFTERTILPSLCSDGVTVGFQDWPTLKAAVQEANALSAERFLRWNEYFATMEGKEFGAFFDDSMYYEEDVFFTICPAVTLKARRGPIFINAENIVLECEDCTIDVGGTHLAFGPHAKGALVRGITFKGAYTSSLTFYHDGSEASFEDCLWVSNARSSKHGAIADVNSTSNVSFYRCEVADGEYPLRRPYGMEYGFASSLTIRS